VLLKAFLLRIRFTDTEIYFMAYILYIKNKDFLLSIKEQDYELCLLYRLLEFLLALQIIFVIWQ